VASATVTNVARRLWTLTRMRAWSGLVLFFGAALVVVAYLHFVDLTHPDVDRAGAYQRCRATSI